jgi:hypothetical protein
MTTSLTRTLAAATFVLFAVAACAGPAPQWTFVPVSSSPGAEAEESLPVPSENPALPDAAPAEASPVLESAAPEAGAASPAADAATEAPAAPDGSVAPAASTAPAASGGADASGAPASEGTVVDIQATGSLSFTTPDGEKITDIPVTPGETVTFRVDNVAGFDHNFHIGTDAELSVPNNGDLPGIPTWSSGVQEFEWTVPDDVTGLKFGCTVPGHYSLMQGTFSAAS